MLEWGRKSGGIVPVEREGRVVAELRPSSFRERADVAIEGAPWQFFKRSGDLHAVREGMPEALTASRPSFFRQAWEVDAGTIAYRIEPAGFFRSGYHVLCGATRIGYSDKIGFWTRRPTLDVDPSVPLEHQVFLLWVAYVMRKRSEGAATAGGGGGAT